MKKLLNRKEFNEYAKKHDIKLQGTGDVYVQYIEKYLTENKFDNIDQLRKALMPFFHNDQDEYDNYYNMSGPFIMQAFEDLQDN